MNDLPDDVLLLCLQYLRLPDLLACRVTCKRLEAMCRHPDVWRHRMVRGRQVGPALRLAPCVRKLCLELAPELDMRDLPYDTTCCAAAHLSIVMGGDFGVLGDWSSTVARVIRNQEALGRLRHLRLELLPQGWSSNEPLILATALMTSLLESLEVRGLPTNEHRPKVMQVVTSVRAPPYRTFGMSPLKSFCCNLEDDPEFCNYVLGKNVATLEEVRLVYSSDESDFGSLIPNPITKSAGIAPLLARMPRLRTLTCPPLEGMEAVAANKSVRKVTLVMNIGWGPGAAGAAGFLRRATHLRDVAIVHWTSGATNVDLVMSLASSGRSQVEKLDVSDGVWTSFIRLAPLVSALSLLHNLRELRLYRNTATDDLLLELNPGTVPNLVNLNIHHEYHCCHEWMHKEAFRMLMLNNPALHVQLDFPSCHVQSSVLCIDCKIDCHPELRSGRQRAGLFSHPKGQCSSPPLHQSARYLWFQL